MRARAHRLLVEMGLTPLWHPRSGDAAAVPAATLEVAPGAGAPPDPGTRPGGAATLSSGERARSIAAMEWPELKAAVAGCTACKLCRSRTQTVFGVGDERAGLMIVGEAPGQEEDARGEPFVGQAGRLLDNMLRSVDMERGRDVYIANVLKCRPPGNRNPEPGEVEQCSPYLVRQIQLIRPALIVAMGRFAAQTLLATDASISSLRGRLFQFHQVPLVVTYHPAYLLRTLADKSKAWEDLLFMRRELARRKTSQT